MWRRGRPLHNKARKVTQGANHTQMACAPLYLIAAGIMELIFAFALLFNRCVSYLFPPHFSEKLMFCFVIANVQHTEREPGVFIPSGLVTSPQGA